VTRLRFFFVITAVERLIDEAFYLLLQLDVWLGLVHDLAPTGDIILHQVFLQWVGLHPVDECESIDSLAVVMYSGR